MPIRPVYNSISIIKQSYAKLNIPTDGHPENITFLFKVVKTVQTLLSYIIC